MRLWKRGGGGGGCGCGKGEGDNEGGGAVPKHPSPSPFLREVLNCPYWKRGREASLLEVLTVGDFGRDMVGTTQRQQHFYQEFAKKKKKKEKKSQRASNYVFPNLKVQKHKTGSWRGGGGKA